MLVCPSCGGKKVPGVRSFQTLAEPAKYGENAAPIGITIRQCEKCGVEFPGIMSRRKYSLVPEKEVEKITRELAKLREENRSLEQSLSELARKQVEAGETLENVKKTGELSEMGEKLNVLEEEVSYLRSEKRQLAWLLSTLELAAPLPR